MPLTSGILSGIVAVFVGVAMYLGTQQKKMAAIMICLGLGVALLTIGIVALAVNSGM